MATKFLWQYSFTSELEKEIWRLHSEGLSLREISTELHTKGHRMFKDKIHAVVRHLKAAMMGQKSGTDQAQDGQLSLGIIPKVKKDE